MINNTILAKKRKSVFLSWVLSYLLILLVPVVISWMVFVNTRGIVENEINRANRSLLDLVRQTMDSRLSETRKLAMQLSMNPRIGILASVSPEMRNNDWYTLSELSTMIATYTASNEFIYEFYIYFNKTGVILKSGGSTYPEYIYESLHSGAGLSYGQWQEMMNQKFIGEFLTMPLINAGDGRSSEVITYLQTVRKGVNGEPAATLVVLLKESELIKAVNSIHWVNRGTVFIIDQNDRLIASTRPMELNEKLSYDQLDTSRLVHSSTENSGNIIVTSTGSAVAQWKYASVIPEKLFMEKVAYIRTITYAGIVLCLIIGGIIAYIFTQKNYHPLKELVQLIVARAGIDLNSSYNEYRFIKEILSDTFDEKDKISKTIQQQNSVLRSNFLTRLVKGKICYNESINDSLELFNLKFDYNDYAVMLFYVEDYNGLFKNGVHLDPDKKFRLVQFIISNVVEELAVEIGRGYVFEVDEMLACLINLKESRDDTAKQELLRLANKAYEFIYDHFHISFTVAVSSIGQTVYCAFAAYRQALNAMEYKMLLGNQTVILYDDIAATQKSDKIYAYLENDQILINCIKSAEFDNAKNILDRAFRKNFSEGVISVQMAKCFMFGLINTMIKTMDEISVICDNTFIDRLNPIERLLNCSTITEMQKEITEILKSVCDYINEKRSHKADKIKDEILEFITSHYQDENLSLSMIAENSNVSISYISKFFKEQFGEGTLDFINRLRLEKAKQLLKDQNLGISQIAEKVGYYNANTFIRVFKKYEGITPGKYKESM